MMGGVSPETRWASYKYEIIKFWYIVTVPDYVRQLHVQQPTRMQNQKLLVQF